MDGPTVEVDASATPLPDKHAERMRREQERARARAEANAQRLAAEQARAMRMDVSRQVQQAREQADRTLAQERRVANWRKQHGARMYEVAQAQFNARAGEPGPATVPRIAGAPLAQEWLSKYTAPEKQAVARQALWGGGPGGSGGGPGPIERGAEKAGQALSDFASKVAVGAVAISGLRTAVNLINSSMDRRQQVGEEQGGLELRASEAARAAGASNNTLESVLTTKQSATREMQVQALQRIAAVSKQRVEKGLPTIGDKLTRQVLSDVVSTGDMAPVEALESPMGAMGMNYAGAVSFRLGGMVGDRSLPADEAVRQYGAKLSSAGRKELAVRSQVDLAGEVAARSIGDTGNLVRIAESQARMGTEVGIAENIKKGNFAGAAIMEAGAQTDVYRMSSRVDAMSDANRILSDIKTTLDRQTAIMERGQRTRPEAGTETAP